MIKAIIADDHAIVRRGLSQILADEPDMAAPGEVRDAQELMDSVLEQDWDVVILDIAMPGKSGFDILKDLKSMKPDLPVLILSIHPEEQYAIRTLKAGAAGYINKESAPTELVKAIRKAVAGGKYVSPALAEKLAFELDGDFVRSPHGRLSDREYQVLCLIASGKRVKEIAEELSLSDKTVSTYRSRILEKMKMETNAELTYYAIKNRLVE